MFRSEIFFRTTQELEYYFFCCAKREFLSPEFNIRLYDKNSESDYFFPPPKSEYFFQRHWESECFFRKKNITPPFKLNSRFYAKKADYRISLLPLTSNSKNKTVVTKLHCMSNLEFKFHFNPLSGYLGVAGCRIILLPPPPGLQ